MKMDIKTNLDELPSLMLGLQSANTKVAGNVLATLRDLAIEIIGDTQAVERPMAEHIRKAYTAKGLAINWNLRSTDAYDYYFRNPTPAAQMLYACTKGIDDGLNESTIQQIAGGLAALLRDEARRAADYDERKAINDSKRRQNAKQPRKKPLYVGGPTLHELIKRIARHNPGEPAQDLWVRFVSNMAVEVEAEEHIDAYGKPLVKYYDSHDKLRTLSFGRFSVLVSKFITSR